MLLRENNPRCVLTQTQTYCSHPDVHYFLIQHIQKRFIPLTPFNY